MSAELEEEEEEEADEEGLDEEEDDLGEDDSLGMSQQGEGVLSEIEIEIESWNQCSGVCQS